MMVFPTIMKN